MKIQIRYKRLHLRWIFVFGLFWLVLGIIAITNNFENYLNYGYLIVALLYFGIYFFKSKKQYLTFENNVITLNKLIPKKINLADLKQLKKNGKDYILKSDIEVLYIKTSLIDKNSRKDLNTILKNWKAN
ncbi:hypothetical protein ACFQZW_04175 [Lutibacter aestuarii]|uniref:PH domain-containing protein n=1 Tax=Lutibacter aestuarii TaxID=861111 RepID=A0ABW2Z5S1_9FLAO